jgi:tetratricopeptide (TPR) repeat protein
MKGGDRSRRAKAIEALGGIAWWQGDVDACVGAYREALELQRDLGDEREIANALYNLGLTDALFVQDPQRGEPLMREALEIYERIGDLKGIADVHWGLGNLALHGREDLVEAISHFETSVTDYRETGNVFGEGWALFELGEAHRRAGHFDPAREHYEVGLRLLYGTGDVSAAVLFMMVFAGLALAEGDLARAHRLGGAGYAAADRSGIDLINVAANRIEGLDREILEATTGDLAAAYAEGSNMAYDEAVEYALGDSPGD